MTRATLSWLGVRSGLLTWVIQALIPIPAYSQAADREIVVGGDFEYKPYEWIDPRGRATGFNVDLLRAIGESRGFRVRFELGPWSRVRTEFEKGKIDAVAMFKSAERSRQFDFAPPHLVMHHVIVTRKGVSGLKSLDDIQAKKVVVQQASYIHDYLGSAQPGGTLIPVGSEVDALRLLASGVGDCALVTEFGAEYFVDEHQLDNLVVSSPPLLPRDYCLAVRKGNTALLEDLSRGMEDIRASGVYGDLRKRWFSTAEGHSLGTILWYGGWIIVPLVVFAITGFAWVHSLRITVDKRTRELRDQLKLRREAEQEVRELNQSLEDRVRDRTTELEAANIELESFSYSVSHDLRAPLRAIEGFTRILLDEQAEQLDDEGRRVLRVVESNTHKMGQLIDELLEFSRLGRKALRPEPIDMDLLFKEAFEEVRAVDSNRDVQFRVQAIPMARGDRGLVLQLIVNLVSNAFKYTRPKAPAVIEVGGGAENGLAEYFVRDNGVGFNMKYSPKLFGVFQRLHGEDEFEGTGVGLALAQRVVQRHGGRIWAEGKVGEGATFRFTLPHAEREDE